MAAAAATTALPSIYSFPPFFTLQPNDAVRAKQLQEWCNIIVKWHEERKVTTMRVAEWELWANAAIDRRLNSTGIAAVMQHMEEVGRCEWMDGAKTTARIFYKTPAEWATAILAYVHDNAMDGTLFVLYDLVQGDTTLDAPFHGLDAATMAKALAVLQADGKADIYPKTDLDEMGVMFKGA